MVGSTDFPICLAGGQRLGSLPGVGGCGGWQSTLSKPVHGTRLAAERHPHESYNMHLRINDDLHFPSGSYGTVPCIRRLNHAGTPGLANRGQPGYFGKAVHEACHDRRRETAQLSVGSSAKYNN